MIEKKGSQQRLKVLVPGMFSKGCVYHPLANEMNYETETLIADFPMRKGAFGPLYSGECQFDFQDKLDYLLKILRGLKKDYDLIGHSAGAVLVLVAASFEDINPGRIFLIAPAPVNGLFHLYPSVIKSFWFVIRNPYFMTKSIDMSYCNFRWAMAHTLPEKKAMEIYHQYLRSEDGKFIFQVGFWFLDPDKSTLVDFTKVHCQIDVFVGSEDRVTPVPVAKKIKKLAELERKFKMPNVKFPPVRCLVFPECSHWLFEERKEELAEWIVDSSALDNLKGL